LYPYVHRLPFATTAIDGCRSMGSPFRCPAAEQNLWTRNSVNFIRIGLGRRRKKKVAAEIEDEDVELKEDVTTVEISLAEAETPKTWFFSFRAISSLRSVSLLPSCRM